MDGCGVDAVQSWASLGANGQSPQNEERDLMRWTRSIEGLELLPYYIWLDLEQEGHAALAPVKVPILLPHEMMAMLHSAGPLQWAISMAGPRGKDGIAALWNHLAGLEEWRDHWALQAPRDTQGLIPIACHVDGTEVFTNQEHVVWSWSSVMARKRCSRHACPCSEG
jgi:hypothetical protein